MNVKHNKRKNAFEKFCGVGYVEKKPDLVVYIASYVLVLLEMGQKGIVYGNYESYASG